MAVAVRLALVGAPPSAVEVFVSEVPRSSRGQLFDDLAAQLARDTRFLPVRTASRVRLIGKHAIAWIAIGRQAAPAPEPAAEATAEETAEPTTGATAEPAAEATIDSPEELTLFDHQHFVEIELAHGTKLIGTLLDSAPADHSRVIDHLNDAGRFVRLWTTDQHYLINTAQIVAVTELGEVW
jgi:hypothetical protein